MANAYLGWCEKSGYQASGPTGDMTAMTHDLALKLIMAQWVPASEASCPSDHPIASCNLKPEQRLFTIKLETAMK